MAAEMAHDLDDDSWVLLDDAAGVLSLSSGYTTPDCRSDDDENPGLVFVFPSTRNRKRSPPPSPIPSPDADADDAEGLYDPADAEEVAPVPSSPSPAPRPLSGLFYHNFPGGITYAPFEPVLCRADKVFILDPTFSAACCFEEVKLLASTRGLVCLRGNDSGAYFVANPATSSNLVQLPSPSRDHLAYGNPSVVIAFEDDAPRRTCCCTDHRGHYHVVVTFPLGHGVYAYESFSSRTWNWTVATGIDAVGQVVSASGVGAIGRAFWRTGFGYILSYNPANRTAGLIPAPQEVLEWPCWELGEMNDTLCVTCMDERVNEVLVTNLHLDPLEGDGAGETVNWSLVAHFEGGCMRNRDRVSLLRSQGPEVVMWDPTLEIVVAMDTEGRTTRTVGPLSGQLYYSDFIPYVRSSTGVTRVEAEAECVFTAADAEA